MSAPSVRVEELEPSLVRPGLRERKRQRLRRQIVATSLELFQENGFEGTRVVDIVEALEISQPTFFRYFPSKAAVLYEAASMALEGPLQEVLPRISAECNTATEKLRALVEVYANVIVSQRPLARMITSFSGTETMRGLLCPNAAQSELSGQYDDGSFWRQFNESPFLTEVLLEGRRTGEFSDQVLIGQLRIMLWSMMFAIVVVWAQEPEPGGDLRSRLLEALDVFLTGLRRQAVAA
jgi:AcrR family transcriptional regulator